MNSQNLNIEIKKATLIHLQHAGESLDFIIEELLNNFLSFYECNINQTASITQAVEYIQAYLQLGFSYLNHKTLFDSVLDKAGWNPAQIGELQTKNKVILLNKTQLRSIIGRWPASPYNSHTITEAINDIITHVKNNHHGTFYYYTAKKDGIYTALYQLVISSEYALFHDVCHNIYYQLVKE